MPKSKLNISCRECPSRQFELSPIKREKGPSRFIAICHAREVVLRPQFPDNTIEDTQNFINKSNFQLVQFKPCDNCPHIEKLVNEGKLLRSIDFLLKTTRHDLRG